MNENVAKAMEHRCGERCSLQVPVTLVTGNCAPLRATVRNVSAGGMLLDGLTEVLAPYEFVDIVIAVPGRETRVWRWPAMVVRSSYGSTALMFDRLRFGDLRRLLRSLRQAPFPEDRLLLPLPPAVTGNQQSGQRYH